MVLAVPGCQKAASNDPSEMSQKEEPASSQEGSSDNESHVTSSEDQEIFDQPSEDVMVDDQMNEQKAESEETEAVLQLMIGETAVEVAWEDNTSVAALMEMARESPLTIQMSMYGGFEQVGAIGTSLPKDDVQTTTEAGDIVLYSGDQIVVFYGSNSWAYTRLGKITDQTASDLKGLLSNGDVTITIFVR
ncbi:MAG: hypothetical protein K6A77_01220 [Clostridiales bacterium]|nr:hypothetical protein [Clostridiales bacterium]